MMFNIPNLLTIGNLISGVLGIIYVLENGPQYAIWFVVVSAFFDFLDGFVARLMKISGEMGKQLDSLADMVSFGVLPGIVFFTLLKPLEIHPFLPYLSFLIVAFSALRLAKFNIDTRQTHGFLGLPTPANTLLVVSLPSLSIPTDVAGIVYSILIVVLSLLLTSDIPMMALKFKKFGLKENLDRYLFVVWAVICLAIWGLAGIAYVIGTYILYSILMWVKSIANRKV